MTLKEVLEESIDLWKIDMQIQNDTMEAYEEGGASWLKFKHRAARSTEAIRLIEDLIELMQESGIELDNMHR